MINMLRSVLTFLKIKNFMLRVLLDYNEKTLLGLTKEGYLFDVGYQRSLKEKSSIDKDGNPIPWITYSAYEFLKKHVKKDMRVYEYGSGASTLWFAERVKNVVSVEHDYAWFKQLEGKSLSNVEALHFNLEYGGEYSQSIRKQKQTFDIILIDGRDRVNCFTEALNYVAKGGIIIFDNSERVEYNGRFNIPGVENFTVVDYIGLCPSYLYLSQTSIYKKQ